MHHGAGFGSPGEQKTRYAPYWRYRNGENTVMERARARRMRPT